MPNLELYAAGSNSHGQLGIAHEDDAHTFTRCNLALQVTDIETLQVELCAGANHTLLFVRHDGLQKVFVAGSSRRGQLGKIDDENKLSFARLPVNKLVQEPSVEFNDLRDRCWTFKDVAAAWETSFFLLEDSEDPSETLLLASGSNDFGQLGIADSKKHCNIISIPGRKKIVSVHSGPRHTVAIGEDGSIYGWGASRHGQLGYKATQAITYTPVALSEVSVDPSCPAAVALGHQHTVLVTKNKEDPVSLLGNNKKGQLGTSDPKSKLSSPDMKENGTLNLSSIEVFANWNASFVLNRVANKLYSFGNNASGQLGRESHSFGDINTVEFDKNSEAMTIVQVATGSEHTLALLEDKDGKREAWGWGWNEHGNLSLGQDVLDDVRKPVRLTVPSNGKIHSVHAGNGTSWVATIEDIK